ncbi:MAG: SLATT domain-containing protein [Chloroflexota bacterium]|nr:SLATT domain-containing protein [Chloroflexota bacterium]
MGREGLPPPSSPPDADLRGALNDEAKRLILDAAYSGRGHMEAAAFWQLWDSRLGLPATLLSTLLAAGASVAALLKSQPELTAGLAGLAALLNAARAFLQPREKAQGHGLKGNKYITIRNEARLIREIDLRSGLAAEELCARIKALRGRYAELKESDPLVIPRGAYEKAKRGIEAGESSYDNDPIWKELG